MKLFTSRVALILGLAIALLSAGPEVRAESARKPVLVELFTSEGCSSCPPADTFLRELDGKQPLVGAQVIAIEEHVDYWDGDGWRDPFSLHDFTLRQSAYAERLRLSGPYTPQMVVDGTYEFVGNDRIRADQAFQKAVERTMIPIRISSSNANGKFLARIETDPVGNKAGVWMALVSDHAQSQVLRGENGGRHLEHVAVARKLSRIGNAGGNKSFSKDVTIGRVPEPSRIIVFLQEPGQGDVIGVGSAQLQP
jgi:hypothetical protein